MERVVVQGQNGSIRLCISFGAAEVVVNPEIGKPIDAVAARIAKKLRQPDACFVDGEGCSVHGDCSALETSHVLKIAGCTLPVFINPPSARGLTLPAYPMVGLPVMPVVVLENTQEASWCWLRGEDVLSNERFYVPSANDVGSRLVCVCTPLPDGVQVSVESDLIQMAPQLPAVSRPDPCGDFRVLSYNLLADYNLKPDLARGDSDYLHLTPDEKEFQYRRQFLLREIVGFNSDILCFQEVDRDTMYEQFLHGHLGRLGYDGVYTNKVHTSTPVGNAVFWCRKSWCLITAETLDLTQGEAIQCLLEASPTLGFAMSKTTTVANLVVLEDKAGHRLAVANLHLFGDPAAPHIRLLQTYLVLEAAKLHSAALVICGDFNSGPDQGVCELLAVGFIDEDHPDWIRGRGFEWGALCDKRVDPASIPHDQWCPTMQLTHTYTLNTVGVPDYTFWNGRRGFVVDHIFFEATALQLHTMVPVTPVAVVCEHGVASPGFPSDHVAIVADLCWKEPRG